MTKLNFRSLILSAAARQPPRTRLASGASMSHESVEIKVCAGARVGPATAADMRSTCFSPLVRAAHPTAPLGDESYGGEDEPRDGDADVNLRDGAAAALEAQCAHASPTARQLRGR